MAHDTLASDPIDAIGALGEPTRRRLYEYVVGQHEPVGRDQAAAAVGIGRPLAAFHLDRLVESGLLEAEYRRLTGRTGPGAGRPAKVYRRGPRPVEVSLPDRRYELAARLFAAGLEAEAAGESTAMEGLLGAARSWGEELARAAESPAGDLTGGTAGAAPRHPEQRELLEALRRGGFEPEVEPRGAVRLRNCPFDALAKTHRAPTCAMNLALLEGLSDGLRLARLEPAMEIVPGYCCVTFRPVEG